MLIPKRNEANGKKKYFNPVYFKLFQLIISWLIFNLFIYFPIPLIYLFSFHFQRWRIESIEVQRLKTEKKVGLSG